MFIAKVSILLLAAVLVASESDLEKGLAIMDCAKKAITVGVPSLHIPTHDPYIVFKRNINWTGVYDGNHIDLLLQNVTLAGLAKWDLAAAQISNDTDADADFNFELYWDTLTLTGQHDVTIGDNSSDTSYKGSFEVDFVKTNWIGSINVTKPTSSSNGTVNDLQIKWHAEATNFGMNGTGPWDVYTELYIELMIYTVLNMDFIDNDVGDFINKRLSVWWETGKVWELTDWCNSN